MEIWTNTKRKNWTGRFVSLGQCYHLCSSLPFLNHLTDPVDRVIAMSRCCRFGNCASFPAGGNRCWFVTFTRVRVTRDAEPRDVRLPRVAGQFPACCVDTRVPGADPGAQGSAPPEAGEDLDLQP